MAPPISEGHTIAETWFSAAEASLRTFSQRPMRVDELNMRTGAETAAIFSFPAHNRDETRWLVKEEKCDLPRVTALFGSVVAVVAFGSCSL